MKKTKVSKKKSISSSVFKDNNLAVFNSFDDGITRIYSLDSYKPLTAGLKHTENLLVHQEHYWHYWSFFLRRTQQGKLEIDVVEFFPYVMDGDKKKRAKGTISDFAKPMTTAHVNELPKRNTQQLVNTGWIALPYHPDESFDATHVIDVLCDMRGCWDFRTPYEQEKLDAKK